MIKREHKPSEITAPKHFTYFSPVSLRFSMSVLIISAIISQNCFYFYVKLLHPHHNISLSEIQTEDYYVTKRTYLFVSMIKLHVEKRLLQDNCSLFLNKSDNFTNPMKGHTKLTMSYPFTWVFNIPDSL